jgi:DNA invertase Pin-like site-specific DNA recombinase
MSKLKIKAATYSRVAQADKELCDRQTNTLKAVIEQKKREMQFVEAYEDCGKSGHTLDREEFKRMMADATEGKFQVLVVKSASRISRSLREVLFVISQLRSLGVKVLFADGTTEEQVFRLANEFGGK